MDTRKESYITKLLTLLIRKNSGCIRVSAQELMAQDIGEGIRVWWDADTKELVIDFMPAGAMVYTIKENMTWVNSEVIPQSLQPPQALTRENLLERIYVRGENPDPLPQDQQDHPKKPRVVVLTDESLAQAETERRKRQAMKELEGLQPQQPPHRQPLYQPQSPQIIPSFSPRASGFSKP